MRRIIFSAGIMVCCLISMASFSGLKQLWRTYCDSKKMQAPLVQINALNVGLDGYDPVVLYEKQVWKAGDGKYCAAYLNRTYLFSGEDSRKRFCRDPKTYAPLLGGLDIIESLKGQSIDGHREHGIFFGGHIYLFSNEANLETFSSDPIRFKEFAAQAKIIPLSNDECSVTSDTHFPIHPSDNVEIITSSDSRVRKHSLR
jgi:YHS domain-containing protein